ncbi:MAG: hypothetical protein M3Y17_02975 [Actinomycetota bacterium]|nr:hypothetical protein [Actinomycetota bacterium]
MLNDSVATFVDGSSEAVYDITFAVSLIAVMVGITYGSSPTATTRWAGRARRCSLS